MIPFIYNTQNRQSIGTESRLVAARVEGCIQVSCDQQMGNSKLEMTPHTQVSENHAFPYGSAESAIPQEN